MSLIRCMPRRAQLCCSTQHCRWRSTRDAGGGPSQEGDRSLVCQRGHGVTPQAALILFWLAISITGLGKADTVWTYSTHPIALGGSGLHSLIVSLIARLQ